MAGALEGFVTGFSGTLAPVILERKKEARDFFNKQVEYARTTGLQNRNRVREASNANLSIARQLEQLGVPRDVIMAQINMDPQGLGAFYESSQKIAAKTGRNLTAEEWASISKVGGDFKAPDEDLATFISRTYDPIANAVSAPGFGDDPEGNLIASMMGFSAMDEARAELGRTQIAEGLTAEQLIQYGDVQPQRIGGNAVVTTDFEGLNKIIPEDGMTISESTAVNNAVVEAVKTAGLMLEQGSDATAALDNTVTQLQNIYPTVPRQTLETLAGQEFISRGYTLGGSETPAEGEEGVVPTEGSPEIEGPPTAFSGPLTVEEVAWTEAVFDQKGKPVVSITQRGTESVVTFQDGTVVSYPTEQLRQAVEQARNE